MRHRKIGGATVLAATVVVSTTLLLVSLSARAPTAQGLPPGTLYATRTDAAEAEIARLRAALENQQKLHKQQQQQQQRSVVSNSSNNNNVEGRAVTVVPVVVITCKRAQYLDRALTSLLSRIPQAPLPTTTAGEYVDFTVVVSRDCNDAATEQLLQTKYADSVAVMRHTPSPKKVAGYAAIAAHYGWALEQIFGRLRYDAAVLFEEDMEVAPDFFEYFAAGLGLLRADPSVWCVSAWNDNGLRSLVTDPRALYRTDFFPGLGWMLLRELWNGELRDAWPAEYWDEFMRLPAVRRGRACIRPEISRTLNFGEHGGVSQGQYYASHLSRIVLNSEPVPWTTTLAGAWEALRKEVYDPAFESTMRNARHVGSVSELKALPAVANPDVEEDVLVEYQTGQAGWATVAKAFGLMEELKEGIPRGSYHGVVVFKWQGRRVFLSPRQ